MALCKNFEDDNIVIPDQARAIALFFWESLLLLASTIIILLLYTTILYTVVCILLKVLIKQYTETIYSEEDINNNRSSEPSVEQWEYSIVNIVLPVLGFPIVPQPKFWAEVQRLCPNL